MTTAIVHFFVVPWTIYTKAVDTIFKVVTLPLDCYLFMDSHYVAVYERYFTPLFLMNVFELWLISFSFLPWQHQFAILMGEDINT